MYLLSRRTILEFGNWLLEGKEWQRPFPDALGWRADWWRRSAQRERFKARGSTLLRLLSRGLESISFSAAGIGDTIGTHVQARSFLFPSLCRRSKRSLAYSNL